MNKLELARKALIVAEEFNLSEAELRQLLAKPGVNKETPKLQTKTAETATEDKQRNTFLNHKQVAALSGLSATAIRSATKRKALKKSKLAINLVYVFHVDEVNRWMKSKDYYKRLKKAEIARKLDVAKYIPQVSAKRSNNEVD